MSWSEILSLIMQYPDISLIIGVSLLIFLVIIIAICVRSRRRKAIIEAEPASYTYADLANELRKADGLTPELQEKCRSFGVDYLTDFLELIPRLNGKTATGLKQIAREEKWLMQYIANIRMSKTYSLELIAKAWKASPDKEILPQLVELLSDKDEAVRMAGVDIIAAIEDKAILPYLIAALLQPDIYLPARVAEALSAFKATAAQLLVEILPSLSYKDKIAVIDALSQMPYDYPLINVLVCLTDKDESLRARTAAALGEAQKHDAAAALLLASEDEKWQVRSAAIKALGQLNHLPALPRAVALLSDEAFAVRANAGETWKILTAAAENESEGASVNE